MSGLAFVHFDVIQDPVPLPATFYHFIILNTGNRMRHHLSLLPLLALVATLTGCAYGGAKINSRPSLVGDEQIKKLIVYYNAKSPLFTDSLYTTFVASTQRRIEACGVKVTTFEFDPLDLDLKEKIEQAISQKDPDAVLIVARNGWNIMPAREGIYGNLYFDAQITDKKRSTVIWRAKIDYTALTNNMYIDDKKSGERFSAQFVSQLVKDQLFTGCPIDVKDPKI